MERLKPLNDFIFKKLFGEKGDEPMLLSFLNAVLNRTQKEELAEIEIVENKELTKELLVDKTDRIDVRAKTTRGEQIDIEVQSRAHENKALIRWLTFLQKDISREVLEELMEMDQQSRWQKKNWII